ncbi:hypothetical protein Tco_0892972 [Tanacetum coccineum]|uniref:Uncharacterized protein n=1 Tax=Tanacetum coccineum TaxID=301880 RepID=A0ABQ5C7F0_9ASTR
MKYLILSLKRQQFHRTTQQTRINVFLKQHEKGLLTEKGRLVRVGIILLHIAGAVEYKVYFLGLGGARIMSMLKKGILRTRVELESGEYALIFGVLCSRRIDEDILSEYWRRN